MRVSSLLVLAVVCALLFVTVSAKKVLFNRDSYPSDWIKGSRASPDSTVNFHLALKHRNEKQLEQLVAEVSDPWHDNYQQFKTIEEINEMVSPSKAEVRSLISRLATYGIQASQIENFGDSLKITNVPVSVAEALFDTEFYVFVSNLNGKQLIKAYGEYSLPSALTNIVEMVFGLSNFPIPRVGVAPVRASPNAAPEAVIPQTIFSIYGVPSNQVAGAQAFFTQGVIEFEGQYFNNSDLVKYGNITGINVQPLGAGAVIGVNDESQPQTESSLDIDLVAGVNIQATSMFYIQDPVDWLYEFVTSYFNNVTVPKIASISYGWWENDQCRWDQGGNYCSRIGVDNVGYVHLVNFGFAKIASRGLTIIVASGDSGANGRTDEDCSAKQLRPAYPSSSPYVTSVGATEIANATYNLPNPPSPLCSTQYSCISGGYEQAVSLQISFFASGGGFSNISGRGDWQWDAVASYLNSSVKLPPSSYYAGMGRGAPDIAAIGHAGLIVQGGQVFTVGGTSQSAPTIAGIFGLLQVPFFAKTGSYFGFLNPLIYGIYAQYPNAFNDITKGDNICTESGCSASCTGYYATKGWDPVTGVGSPNYPNLLNAINQVADMVVARRQAKANAKAQAARQ